MLCLLGVLGGCGDKKEIAAFVAQHRGAIEASLKPLESLPALVDAVPPFAAHTVKAPPDGPMDFELGRGNGIIMHLEDLKDLRQPAKVAFRLEGSGISDGWTAPSRLKQLLVGGEWTGLGGLKMVEAVAGDAERWRFALVLRMRVFEQLERTGEKDFIPAHVEGDAVLVDLKSQTVLAGFPLAIDGKATMALRSRRGPAGIKFEESATDASDIHLRVRMMELVREGLRGAQPSARLPYQSSFAGR